MAAPGSRVFLSGSNELPLPVNFPMPHPSSPPLLTMGHPSCSPARTTRLSTRCASAWPPCRVISAFPCASVTADAWSRASPSCGNGLHASAALRHGSSLAVRGTRASPGRPPPSRGGAGAASFRGCPLCPGDANRVSRHHTRAPAWQQTTPDDVAPLPPRLTLGTLPLHAGATPTQGASDGAPIWSPETGRRASCTRSWCAEEVARREACPDESGRRG